MKIKNKLKKIGKLTKKVLTMSEESRAKYSYPKYREKLAIDDKAIFLESRNGKEIAGNIFYLLKELTVNEDYAGYKIHITIDDDNREKTEELLKQYNIKGYNLVKYCSKEYYRVLATSKYLINDVSFPRYFSKRDEQVYLNVWHGTPLKCLGRSSERDYYQYGNVQRNFMMADYMLYPNEYTRDNMVEDYTIKNLAVKTKTFMAGYPRNTVFYGNATDARKRMQDDGLVKDGDMVYFFMPTWRDEKKGQPSQCIAPHLLMLKLIELDSKMEDNEVIFIKPHPLSQGIVDVSKLKHIKTFPQGYETYDFLNSCDGLITDYSSVFFDYENSNKGIVLWTYDKEDYLADRGVYCNIDEFPYPQASTTDELLKAMREGKQYDSTSVKERFNKYDNKDACRQVLDLLLKGKEDGVSDIQPVVQGIQNKKTIVLYMSNLVKNGITSAFMNLLNSIDKEKYHVVVSTTIGAIKKTPEVVREFPEGVDYMGIWGGYNQTVMQSFFITLYYMRLIPTWMIKGTLKKVYTNDIQRLYPNMKVDALVQFMGYEARKLMMYSFMDAHRVCLVHNDMVKERKTKGNQHKGVLEYVYNHYDSVAVVNEALIEPTSTFIKDKTKIVVVPNTITNEAIRAKGDDAIEFNDETVSTMAYDDMINFLNQKDKVFVTIGRYSPEKDHASLIKAYDKLRKEYTNTGLIIIGGYGSAYNDTLALKEEIDPENKDIILIKGMRNPQPLLRKCDCFTMSSLYEGLPMVIFEADLQGLPVVTTDVSGMHYFVPKHGGTVTPTGEDGVYQGMKDFMEGKVNKLKIDYEAYNRECLEALDKAMGMKGDK